MPQLWILVHYASMRKSAALLMQFNFLKAVSIQTKALHEPWTHTYSQKILPGCCSLCSKCVSIYLQKNTVKFNKKLFKKTPCTSQRVLPKCGTLQPEVWEQLTHHLHHIPTTRLNDKAVSKKAQNKGHYHLK